MFNVSKGKPIGKPASARQATTAKQNVVNFSASTAFFTGTLAQHSVPAFQRVFSAQWRLESMHTSQVSPERLAAAMRAERALAAGKTGRGLFARPEFPDRAACRLLEAAEGGNLQRVQQCLAKGTPAATADLNGHTALHKCAFMGFESIAKLLVASDPGCVNASDLYATQGSNPRQADPRQVYYSHVRPLPWAGCATCRCTRPPSATT